MHSIRALICSMYDFEIISPSNDHYTYDDLCTARMHIGIRKVFECVEPYDLGENYSAAWRARAKVASLFVAIIYDLSRDSRALLVQFSLFGVKCCRLIMYYSGSSRKRKSTSINLGMKISMGHSLRTYSSFHIWWDVIHVLYFWSQWCREGCKNEDFSSKVTNIWSIQDADIISFKSATE